MRVNIYAEEMTDRVEIIAKEVDGTTFTGLRFYLYLPVTTAMGSQLQGPFIHREGDDDSSAVTFWGKRDLREVLRQALTLLDEHYSAREQMRPQSSGCACGHPHDRHVTIDGGWYFCHVPGCTSDGCLESNAAREQMGKP